MMGFIVSGILLGVVTTCNAQVDSISVDTRTVKELQGVTVEASNQETRAGGSTYTPTRRQKKAAQNGIDILRLLGLPEIYIDPVTNNVSSLTGLKVSMFINSMPATEEDINSIKPEDIRKVEFLYNPDEATYGGAQRVLNFVVQQYEYGGYTKLSLQESLLTGLWSKGAAVSKFSFKKMTYQLYAAAQNSTDHHTGLSSWSDYDLTDGYGNNYVEQVDRSFKRGDRRNNQFPVTFQASYANGSFWMRHTVGYMYNEWPTKAEYGEITYLPHRGQNLTYDEISPSRNTSLSYSGYLNTSLGNGFSLNIIPEFSWSHRNNYLFYTTAAFEGINRKAHENAYSYSLKASVGKTIGGGHSLLLNLETGQAFNNVTYSGNSNYFDFFRFDSQCASLQYSFSNHKIRLSLNGGVAREWSEIDNISLNDIYPYAHVNFSYSPDNRNSMDFFLQYVTYSAQHADRTPDILRSTEYLYITGNPKVKNERVVDTNLSYTFLASNSFYLSAYSKYKLICDAAFYTYSPYRSASGSALLRSIVNDGSINSFKVGVTGVLRLFDTKLQLVCSPAYEIVHQNGVYAGTQKFFTFGAQAYYLLKDFYLSASYNPRYKTLNSMYNKVISCSQDYYYIGAGWSKGDWNLLFTCYNPFNSSWKASRNTISTPLYNYTEQYYSRDYARRLALSVTYTVSYGKKVQRGNEVGAQGGAGSAIMY